MHDQVFGGDHAALGTALEAGLARRPHAVAALLMVAGGTPIAAGRVEVPSATGFASLRGGGTLREWRGRGVFRSLAAHRAALAAPPALDAGRSTHPTRADRSCAAWVSASSRAPRPSCTRAKRHDVGSAGWWEGVSAARTANDEHMGEEEHEGLAGFRRHATLDLRHTLAVSFAAYEARARA